MNLRNADVVFTEDAIDILSVSVGRDGYHGC